MLRPNDPFYDRQWNFPAIDMERAWDIQPQAGERDHRRRARHAASRSARRTMRYNSRFPFRLTAGGPVYPPLGVVDVPFAVAPELGDAKFVSPRDFIWDDDLPFDLDGHGTHVSGTVGQLTNNGVGVAGMAYNVRIMPVKVLDDVWDCIFGSPVVGTDDTVARGIRYAADNGAKVINMSIGRTGGGPATVVDDAIRYAVSRGVFVAVAAGNTGDTGNAPSRTAEAAPNIDGMIAVGAVGRSLQRAYYSTTNSLRRDCRAGRRSAARRPAGRHSAADARPGSAPHLCARAAALQRRRAPTSFAYYYFQGTSMATPHVAAFAAMLMQQGITSPAAIEAAMKRFARDLGRAGVDSDTPADPAANLRASISAARGHTARPVSAARATR